MIVEKHPKCERGVKTTNRIQGGLGTSEIFNMDQIWCIVQRISLQKGSYSPSSNILDFGCDFGYFRPNSQTCNLGPAKVT